MFALVRRESARDLGGQDIDTLDRRLLREEVRCLLHQRCGNGTAQVSLPSWLAGKRVEDSERRRTETQGEPHDGFRLLQGKREPAGKKLRERRFLAGFCFETNHESHVNHAMPAFRPRSTRRGEHRARAEDCLANSQEECVVPRNFPPTLSAREGYRCLIFGSGCLRGGARNTHVRIGP